MAAGAVLTLRQKALRLGATSFALTALVQVESAWMRAAPASSAVQRLAAVGVAVLVQYQALLVAVAMVLLLLVVGRARAGRWGVVALFGVMQLLVALDQLAFRSFGEHIAVGQLEGDAADLLPSLARVMGSAFAVASFATYVNVALVVVCTVWLARLLRTGGGPEIALPSASSVTRSRYANPLPLAVAMIAYLVIGVVLTRRSDDARLAGSYPLSALISSDDASTPVLNGAARPRAELERLRDSSWRTPSEGRFSADGALDAVAARFGAARTKPNVVLVVLESVGSEQLLDHDTISAIRTPNLARWREHAVVFPYLYGLYPATTRAHIPLMSGGRTPTWGALADELTKPFTGPTITSAFKARGYRTGLFAAPDLRFGYLRELYKRMPWDTLVHYLDGSGSLKREEEIHSWGVNEDAARVLASNWTRTVQREGRPFFLEFHTVATHHPYEVWGAERAKVEGAEDKARYDAALRYTDAAIGRLMDDLRAQGVLDNTIIAITGDHGESFSEKHPGNWLHRSFLYEENIREALVILSPAIMNGPVVSGRVGGQGDVMPTLLRLAGRGALAAGDSTTDAALGQDLFGPAYRPRIQYFYKDTGPAQLGLRDGRWKFIVHRDGKAPQLFDLVADPDEQTNVASSNGARVAEYVRLATEWYVGSDREYTSRIAGWDSTKARQVTRRAMTGFEPPKLQVGHWSKDDGDTFVDRPVMAPDEAFVVLTTWTNLIEDIPVRVQVVSPGHVVYEYDYIVRSDNETSWYSPGFRPREEGRWRVSLWRGGRRIGVTDFQVSLTELPALRKR